MINPGKKIIQAWYDLLNGNLGNTEVYRVDADSTETDDYVLLRMESSTQSNNNQSFVSFPVLIVEIVTKFRNKIDDTKVYDIDNLICGLSMSTPGKHNLPQQDDIQITEVVRQNETVLPEDDGVTPKINRLIVRYSHRVVQLENV